MEGKQIFTSIPEAIKLIESVGKDHKNEKQGWKFRSIDDVYNAVNKAVKEVGITICPNYEIVTDSTNEITNSYGKKAMQNNVILKANYKLYAKDGSFIEVTTFGKKLDYGDKGFNAAMSTAYKYMMFQVFCIPTEEESKVDPDNDAPTIEKPDKKPETPPKKKPDHSAVTVEKAFKKTCDLAKLKNLTKEFLEKNSQAMFNKPLNELSVMELVKIANMIKSM